MVKSSPFLGDETLFDALIVRDLVQKITDLIKNREMIPIRFRQPESGFEIRAPKQDDLRITSG